MSPHGPSSLSGLIALAVATLVTASTSAQCILTPQQIVPFEPGVVRNATRGTVHATIAWDPDGPGPEPEWLIIAGDFTHVRGVAAPNIAAWDGTRWRSFTSSIDGVVRALAVHQGRLIAAGGFSRVDGHLVRGLIELLPDSWQLFEGRVGPLSTPGDIYTLLSHGESLDIGGSNVGGLSVAVVRWDGTEYRSLFSPTPGVVYDLTLHNGELYASGLTSSFYKNVVRYDGSTWHAVGNGFNAAGYSLASHNGLLFASVAAHSGESASVRVWDGHTWSLAGTPFGSVGQFFSVLSSNNELLVTAPLPSPATGEARMEVLRLDQQAWSPLETGPLSNDFGRTRTLGTWKSELVAAGQKHYANARYLGGVARWTGSAWTSVDDMLSGSILSFVREPNSPNLIAVGPFISIGGTYSPGIARITPDGVESIESPIVLADSEREFVRQVLWWGDRLVVVGSFVVEGSDSMGILIREPGDQWTVPDAPFPWFDIHQALVLEDTLYVVANIEGPNTFTGSLFALRDNAWETIATFPSRPIDMCVYDGELILSGSFTSFGWDPTVRIAAYDGTTWRPFGAGLGGLPLTLTEHRGTLMAAGNLTIGDAQTPAYITRWDGTSWSHLDPPAPTSPSALVSTDVGLLTRIGESVFLLRGGRWTEIPVGPSAGPKTSATTIPSDTSERLILPTGRRNIGVLSNTVQTISSTAIPCEADVNCNQTTDILDLLDFLQAYSGCIDGAPSCNQIVADFNQDGTVDTLDALDFLQAYAQGCP